MVWRNCRGVRGLTIKPEERDPRLKSIFSQEEAAGIFNWLLDGLKDYQKNRLVPSPEMVEATQIFRKNSDQIQRFFAAGFFPLPAFGWFPFVWRSPVVPFGRSPVPVPLRFPFRFPSGFPSPGQSSR